VLLGEAASVAFARALMQGQSPAVESLDPVWRDLADKPRLRSALHQYDTSRMVREAMLHPDDLVTSCRKMDPGSGPG
jgi:hypothetical protein